MPVRWVICPVDIYVTNVGDVLIDPKTGQPDGVAERASKERRPRVSQSGLNYSGFASSGRPGEENDWSVCFVRGQDLSVLDSDPEIVNIFEQDLPDEGGFLARSMEQESWPQDRRTRFRGLFTARRADVSDLTDESPFWMWLERLGDRLDPKVPEVTDMADALRMVLTSGVRHVRGEDQRRLLGEKVEGFMPRGTWVG